MKRYAVAILAVLGGATALSQSQASTPTAPTPGVPLAIACPALPLADACQLFAETAKMMGPSYADKKLTRGRPESERPAIKAFNALGYEAEYYPTRAGLFQGTTDVFLVSKPRSNRIYVVITGTESPRDWLENAKFWKYTAKYKDGQYYVPPAHGGFRRGMLNIINSGILKPREFNGDSTLDC